MNSNKGFTLLEVMIALLIIALTMFAILRIMGLQANHQRYLEDKTYGEWAALNIANQLQLGLIPLPQSLDTLDGQTIILDRTMFWNATFKASADQSTLQTTIDIKLTKNGSSIVGITAYLTPTAVPGTPPL